MRKEEVLILTREDLFESHQNKDISLIDGLSFEHKLRVEMRKSNLVVFVDKNGDNKILKIRQGNKYQSINLFR